MRGVEMQEDVGRRNLVAWRGVCERNRFLRKRNLLYDDLSSRFESMLGILVGSTEKGTKELMHFSRTFGGWKYRKNSSKYLQ
jgi:hypothetical protein